MWVIGGMLMAFTTITDSVENPENVKELSGYQLREKEFLVSDYNLWVNTNEDAFNKTFIADSDGVARPRFDEDWVLAAKVETQSHFYSVKFKKVVGEGNALHVYFGVQKPGKGYAVKPVSIVMAPKNREIRKVNFYHDNMLVRSVPIGLVY
ncbi:MAG: hypothetical protein SGI83_18890 [Bacteroidota bacterium]|nr:hypothetical protein [Bacteroidota bacterium]